MGEFEFRKKHLPVYFFLSLVATGASFKSYP